MAEIDSTPVSEMADASSDDLLDEMRAKRSTAAITPWVIGAVALGLYLLWSAGVRDTPLLIAVVAGALVAWATSARDAVRRTVVIGYDLDEQAATRYEALIDAFKALGSAGGLWHIPSEAQVRDGKYHAGAGSVVSRTGVRPVIGQPPGVRTNLDVPMLKAGRELLCFMPDRVLIMAGPEVAAVSYGGLLIDIGTTRFIEDGGVPSDASVVDHTYRYVNKKGGPDRRFANNAQLPVALYETIQFRSTSGVNELFHVSRIGLGAGVTMAANGLASVANQAAAETGDHWSRFDIHGRPRFPQAVRPAPATPEPPAGGPEQLQVGTVAEILAERGPAWEHRLFAAALTRVMEVPPKLPAPTMPTLMYAAPQVAEWAAAQMQVPQQILGTVERLIEQDLPKALGAPGLAGDADAILGVAWNIGRQAAGAKVWATAVRTTPLPKPYARFRDELARTVDQPMRQLEAFGPQLAHAIAEALSAPAGSPARSINMNLRFTLQNEGELNEAMRAAFR